MGGSGGGNATWRTSLLARAVHVNSWPPAVRAVLARADVLPPEAWVSLTPPQLYVRASNRLVGDYVMTQNNIATPASKNDSIAVGDWSLDQHMTGK